MPKTEGITNMKIKRFTRASLLALAAFAAVGVTSQAAPRLASFSVARAKLAEGEVTLLGLEPIDDVSVPVLAHASDLVKYLPTTVKGHFSDRTTKDFKIVWDAATDEQVSKPGTFALAGTATADALSEKVTVAVSVVGVQTVVSPSLRVNIAKPTEYELPKQALVVKTDGSAEFEDIDWTGVTKPAVDKLGEQSVVGKLATGESVTCRLIGVGAEATQGVNVALGTTGTIDYTNSWDSFSTAVNGKTDEKGISNWQCRDDAQVGGDGHYHLTDTLAKKQTISYAKVYWWTGETNCELPTHSVIEVQNGSGDFEQVKATITKGETVNSVTPFTYTFDAPVEATAVKLGWNMTQGDTDGPQNGKWCNVSELELYEVSGEIAKGTEAVATAIKVDGKAIANFDGYQGQYTVQVPYGTDLSKVNIDVTASDEHATTYVMPGQVDGEAYRVFVVSEDLQSFRTYSIFVQAAPAPLQTLTIALADPDAKILPGTSAAVQVSGTDESGKTLTKADMDVEYIVNSLSGEAEFRGSSIYALSAGYVSVTARATYGGKTVTSNSLLIKIEKDDAVLDAVSVADSNITIRSGESYTLPDTVNVTYSSGIVREESVAWKAIPADRLQTAGQFTVQGYVNNTTLLANLNITVITTEEFSSSSVIYTGVKGVVPTLPSAIPFYASSDGAVVNKKVSSWDSTRFSKEYLEGDVGSEIDAWCTLEGESGWFTVTYKIVEGSDSEDYADRQNGYMIPASFTSTGSEEMMSFTDAKSTVWSPDAVDATPYFGFVFGNAGNIQTKTFSSLGIHFSTADGKALPTGLEVQYFKGSLKTSDLDTSKLFSTSTWTDSALTNDANWTTIDIDNISISENTKLSFDSVETQAFRVKVTGTNFGVDDVTATSKVNVVSASVPTLSKLEVSYDGAADPVNILEDGQKEYTLEVKDASTFSVSPVLADGQSGSVGVVADRDSGIYRIYLTSEDGQSTDMITIRVTDGMSAYKTRVDHVEAIEDISVDSATDASGLNLPSAVGVEFSDGTTGQVAVNWDTSAFYGKAGTYVFNGTLDLPLERRNDLGLVAQARVTVAKDAAATTPEVKTHTVTITGGQGVVASSIQAEAGETVYLVAAASSDQMIASVSGVEVTSYGNGTFSFVMPDEDLTIAVTLQAKETGDSKKKLGAGDIAAITLGTIMGVAIIAGAAIFILKAVKKN